MCQRPVRVQKGMTVTALIEELRHSSFGARSVARACKLSQRWSQTPGLRVVLTVSGALSVAQQSSIVAQLVETQKIHAIVTTGAVITHCLTQEIGSQIRALGIGESDEDLARMGLNRVFDSVESDENLQSLRDMVRERLIPSLRGPLGSAEILANLGLKCRLDDGGLVSTSARHNVPVFVPALSDSEFGLSLEESSENSPAFTYDAFQDLRTYRQWLLAGHDYALLSLGGGVPRNWAQQMFAELNPAGGEGSPRLMSGIRICPDTAALGHLSGSTFSEARSWRKIARFDEDEFIEVFSDFTVVFPLIAISMLSDQQ